MKTSRVVQHIGEAVQAQARPPCSDLGALATLNFVPFQVNLAKLDAYARMESNSGQGAQRGKKVMGVQASSILSARSKLEDAMWEPALRAKARSPRS